MFIRNAVLEQIKSGEVTLAFRRWRRPTVISGGTLHTAIGLFDVESVDQVTLGQISVADAKNAGYLSKKSLQDELAKRDGQIYRIAIAYAREDPRLELRQESELSETDLGHLLTRLQRMDSRSLTGQWTQRVMSIIDEHPKTLASELADRLGCEKHWLKTNVRKLKNLGLTVSHQKGYTLSPRGRTVFNSLCANELDG